MPPASRFSRSRIDGGFSKALIVRSGLCALLLRSSAARRERKSSHSRAPLRCVSKHEGECIGLSSSFETRARTFEPAAPLRSRAPQDEGFETRARTFEPAAPLPIALLRMRASSRRQRRWRASSALQCAVHDSHWMKEISLAPQAFSLSSNCHRTIIERRHGMRRDAGGCGIECQVDASERSSRPVVT
jgi:hypothetical protein